MWNPVDNIESEFPWERYNNSFLELIRSNMIEKNLLPIITTTSPVSFRSVDTPEGVKVGDWIILKSGTSAAQLMYVYETEQLYEQHGELHGYIVHRLDSQDMAITEYITNSMQTEFSSYGTRIQRNWFSPIQVWKVDFNMAEYKFINWQDENPLEVKR